jgi:hypothetical protein
MPNPLMPSLPPQDGVDTQLCAGICTGALAVSAVNRLTHDVGTSLPLPPTGEHKAVGIPSGTLPSPLHALCKQGGGRPRARPHNCLQGLMTSLPMSFGVSTPLHSPHHFMPFASMGGNVPRRLVVRSCQQG